MDALFNNLEALMTVVIIIVAIVSSLLSKKGKAEEDGDEAPSAPPPPQRRPAQAQPRPQPAPANEDLRKTLDDIFSSKQPATYDSQRTTYESQKSTYEGQKQTASYDSRKTVAPNTRASAQPQAGKRLARPASTSIDAEWERALMERAVREAAKAEAKAYAAAEDMAVSIDERELLAQARSGIIWSEILLPPVSMR